MGMMGRGPIDPLGCDTRMIGGVMQDKHRLNRAHANHIKVTHAKDGLIIQPTKLISAVTPHKGRLWAVSGSKTLFAIDA